MAVFLGGERCSLLVETWSYAGGTLVTPWTFLKQHENIWAGQSPRATTARSLTSGRGTQAVTSTSESYGLLHRLHNTVLFQSDTLETCAQHLLGVERSVFSINKSQALFSKL